MKVALVNTPCCEQEYTKFSEKWAFIEDEYIGVNIVHSLLERGGCETVRCNASDMESLLGEVLAAAPDVVMLSVMQTSARTARNHVGRLRDAGYGGKIFIGGWYAKLSWRKIFEECWPVDQVCFTDAEGVLPSWIRNPDGECQGIATYRNYKTIDGVASIKLDDSVAWPQNYIRPKRDPGRKTYRIETSRGCPHSRCTFCSLSRANVIKGGWAPVPVETILSEVKDIHRRYGATAFSLTDDDMLGPLEKAEERAAELRGAFLSLPFEVKYSGSISVKAATNEKILDLLTESGLVQLGIGFESADRDQLRRYCKQQTLEDNFIAAKNITDRSISIIPGLITFDPFATVETVATNLDFLHNHLHHYDLGKLTKRLHVIEGTPMEKMLSDAGLLQGANEGLEYRFVHDETRCLYEDFLAYTQMVQEFQIEANRRGLSAACAVSRRHKSVADVILSKGEWRPYAEEQISLMIRDIERNG